MKIAFVSTILGYPWGGADTLWTHAAEAAVANGDQVLLAVTPAVAAHPRVQALQAAGARGHQRAPHPAPAGRAQNLWRRILTRFPRPDPLVAALRRFDPDLVVVSCGGTGDLVLEPALSGWLRARALPFRVICNWQEENPQLAERDRALLGKIFAAAEAVFFVSSRNLEVTRRWLLRPLVNAAVIQNPVRDSPGGAPLPWPAGPNFRMATVGRLAPEKGISLLLHALPGALGSETGWQLDLFGDGPEHANLAATIAALGLGDRVRLRGRAPELDGIWADHHLLISPAIDEGVPMTIPEAMLRGRPVLATCVGGAEDWITARADGFLCPAPTLPLLTASLQEAWAVRGSWAAGGAAAAVSARSRYRPDDYRRVIQPWLPS